ncbi:hypothetical protein TI04_02340 [Achromatium sp. WMS2]|nr:hypothetical protein TI04_02340 [Achromatium sp. WMS2]
MRNKLIRGLLGAALSVGLVSASIAAGHDNFVTTQYSGAGGSLIKVRGGRGGSCEDLRLACIHKERLGEVGEGNCRRYRENCGRDSGMSHCQRLRWKCMHKEEIGGVGRGYCGRYRRECR